MKSKLAILMGIVIIIADLYWTYTSYQTPIWLYLGVIIFVASIIWIAIDLNLGSGTKESKQAAQT
jgi:uncharacterized membrane protein YcjF (UPF0283 family)